MNLVASILLLFSAALVSSAEPVVSLDYFNNRWAPNSEFKITIDSQGVLRITTASKSMDKVPRQARIPLKKFQELKRELTEIDWKNASVGKIEGRDGTSTEISYGKQFATLWSPDYNSETRGLGRIQKVIETILDLSGLDGSGRPKQ